MEAYDGGTMMEAMAGAIMGAIMGIMLGGHLEGGRGYKLGMYTVRKCRNLLLKIVYFLCYILKQISANESSKRGTQKIPNKRISSGYDPDSLQFASK